MTTRRKITHGFRTGHFEIDGNRKKFLQTATDRQNVQVLRWWDTWWIPGISVLNVQAGGTEFRCGI
jgi:hypothetical protein